MVGRGWAALAGVGAVLLLLVACSSMSASLPRGAIEHHSPSASVRTPTAPAHSAPPADKSKAHPRQVRHAVRTLGRYLSAWASAGPAAASRFLVPSQRSRADQGTPRLASGTVTAAEMFRWHGPDRFVVLASVDLAFRGDPVAWNRGDNDRFVTVHRVGQRRYLLEFATSP